MTYGHLSFGEKQRLGLSSIKYICMSNGAVLFKDSLKHMRLENRAFKFIVRQWCHLSQGPVDL